MITGTVGTYIRHFAFPYWVWYVSGTLALAGTTAISLWIPQLSKDVINAIESAEVRGDLGETALLIIGLGVLLILCRSLSRILIFWPGQKVAADTRSWMIRQFLRLRQHHLIESGVGDLISRMSNDVVHLRLMCGFGLLQILNMTFMLGFALFLMLQTNVLLTVLALLPVSVMLVVTLFGMPFMARFSRQQQAVMGVLTSRVTEAFSHVQTVQTHNAFTSFAERIESENQKQLNVSIKLLAIRTVMFPLMIFFTGLSEVIVIFVGGSQVLSGEMTVGDILTFNVYVSLLSWPLAAVGILFSILQRAGTALERLAVVEQAPKEDFEVDDSVSMTRSLNPDRSLPLLEIRKLSFSYPGREETLALQELSFAMKSGEHVGLCGAVGSGKTTLLSLLTRVYDPPEQTILLEGRDVCQIPFKELRSRIRHVGQIVHLFSDSVRNNLCFGLDPEPSDKMIELALRRAQVWEDIMALPRKLETEIGEGGVRLSGGQKQRLALARMFLRPDGIWLLDDVLSAVDTRTEAALLDELFSLEVPFLISSHRDTTLSRCDRVILLDHGRIRRIGSFDELRTEIEDSDDNR